MAKWMNDAGADAALTWWTDSDKATLCSAQPTTFAEGNATFALADYAPTFDAITNGDASGRKRVEQAKSGVTVDVSGTVTHLAYLKTGDSTLRYVKTTVSQAIVNPGTADVGSSKIELGDPA